MRGYRERIQGIEENGDDSFIISTIVSTDFLDQI